MNGRLQDMMNRSGKSVTYGCYTYYVGDKVVFNANDYEKGYYNGQEGIVTDIQEHNNMQYITIETDDGHINLTGTDMEDIELGYIMTAHKSQGSECKNAVVLIPLHPASLLKRQLLYVEVTRAKECVMILSERDALEQAISCKYEYERSTGLKEKLKKC
jgi:exodeoxyribonuclease V alpha subunit